MKVKIWKQIVLSEILLIAMIMNIDKTFFLACASIIIHEFSHIIVAKYKGSRFNNLQFHIYGAKVELMDLDELTNKDKLIIYIAGATANFILMTIFGIISYHSNKEIFTILTEVNFGLAVFNLLPAYPLDGARILEIILSRKITYKRAQGIISIISYIVAAMFIVFGLVEGIFFNNWNISLLIAGIIIIDITLTEEKANMYILMGNMFKKRNNIIKNGFIENRTISVYYKQGLVKMLTIIDKNRFNTFYVLDDELKLIYILNEDELVEALKLYGNISIEDYVNLKKNGS